jgi:hypothetical protein
LRETWAPPFMEVTWRLRPSFICGCCSCLEEGALEEEGASIAGRSCSGQMALRIDSVERLHTTASLCARVFSPELQGARVLHFSGLDNK